MALTWKARATFRLMKVLEAVHLAPTIQKAVAMPMAKRLSSGPPKGLVGRVPAVPTENHLVRTRDGAEIKVRVYRPDGATVPLLYTHGGGFVVGGITACDHICRRLAVESGAVVASVEYRLAPEHPFPGPLQDCEDALDWFLATGVDAERLVVGGDSAGGNLAAALAIVLRERGTSPAGQLLIYPILDLTLSGEGMRSYDGIGLKAADGRVMVDSYLGGADPTAPLASPLHAPDLSGSAPALVITVEHDALREEGGVFAKRLRDAAVPVTLVDVPDQVHGSLSLPALYRGIDELYVQMSAFVREPGLIRA